MAAHARRKLSKRAASASGPCARSRSSSRKSPPTQKLPPAPAITTTRAREPTSTIACANRPPSSTVIAFIASARLRVMRATPSVSQTRTGSVMSRVGLGADDGHERHARARLAAEIVREPDLRAGDLPLARLAAELLPALEEHPQPARAVRVPEALESAVRVDGQLPVQVEHAVVDVLPALAPLGKPQVLHQHELGRREAVVDLGQR